MSAPESKVAAPVGGHTAGPWSIHVPPHGCDEIRADEGGDLICEFPYGATDGADAANARLIAAAPELLEALTGLLETADFISENVPGAGWRMAQVKARAAIARATGAAS